LGEQVSEDNLFYMLDIVDHFDCARLNSLCGAFLAEHFGDMLEDAPERLMSLKPVTWVEMLKSDDLQIRSEEKLYESVLTYANQFKEDPAKREDTLNQLLPFIRFPFLRPTYLVKKVEPDESVNKLPILHKLLHEAYRFKMYPKSKTTFPTSARKGYQRFDDQHSPASVKLTDDQLKASMTISAGWQNVRCVCPFSPTYNYCEFKLDQGPNVMIGVVQGDCSRSGYAGQYVNGWTYYSQGGLYHSGSTPSTGERYSVGDRVGVKIDFDKGKVLFYRNGKYTLTSDVSVSAGELYPVVCFSALGDTVSIVEKTSKKDIPADDSATGSSSTGSSSTSSNLFGGDDDDMGGLFG